MNARTYKFLVALYVFVGLLAVAKEARCQSFEVQIDSWDVIVSKTPSGLRFTVPSSPQAQGGLVSEPKAEISPPIAVETIEVSCSPVDAKLTQQVLGKAVAKIARMWTCFVTNNGSESILVSEASLLRHTPQIMPYDKQLFMMALSNTVKYSVLQRIERFIQDPVQLSTILGLTKAIAMPTSVILGTAIYSSELPYIESRLKGAEVPMMANYETLTNVGTIAPGATAAVHVFGSPAAPNASVQFSISTGSLPKVRTL